MFPERLDQQAHHAGQPGRADVARRQHRRTIGLAVAGALAIAVHLGLGGAALAALRWTGLAADIVLAVIFVKVIVVTVIALRRLVRVRSRR